MPLKPFRIVKNWLFNTRTREINWDEIADKVGSFANETNNNLKQVSLDSFGPTYDYNNNGVASQTSSLQSQITSLDGRLSGVEFSVGIQNLALSISDTTKVKIVSADGTDLSSTNNGFFVINATSSSGKLVRYTLSANIEVTLTGAHWGFDTFGDQTNVRLWCYLVDLGSTFALGVSLDGAKKTILNTDAFTSSASCVSSEDMIVSSSLSTESVCLAFATVLADFDDTGNVGGENYWTLQTSYGEINVGSFPSVIASEIFF